jgi:hypothetical protein
MRKTNIFDGSDLAVFSIGEQAQGTIITFGSWLKSPYADIPIEKLKGFGEGAFAYKGFKEIHVIPRKNNWYQCSEMSEVIQLIKSEIKTQNNWTYGGSMGGYAAINFSQILDANFISFSPQFSVNKRIVPFENRWVSDRSSIDFMCDHICQKISRSGFVFFDPYSLDHQHAQLIKNYTAAALVPCAFAGHKVLRYIQDAHGAFNLVFHILQTGALPQSLRVNLRANRGVSSIYLSNLHKYCIARQHHRKNGDLYKKFAEVVGARLHDLIKDN